MRELERIDRIVEKLRLAWYNNHDERLCQLVWNIAHNTKWMEETSDVFHVEDSDFEIELNKWFGKKVVVSVEAKK